MIGNSILYDTFNAKYLTYQEVASSFIINDEFLQLISNNHTLLMGPRGGGKTTLLKMLTPIALHYWSSPEAEEIKRKIPFTAIYIPTDIQWKSQLTFLSKHLSEYPEFNEKVTDFLISTNVQVALCRTFDSLIKIEISDKTKRLEIEEEICKQLISVWEIQSPLSASFDDLEIALDKRVERINRIIAKVIYHKDKSALFENLPDYIFSDLFRIISSGCKVYEKIAGVSDKHRWALCFDELEIAPKYLQLKLYSFLRSTDQRFLYKLTTTPLVNIEEHIIEASQDNDYKPVRLWVFDDQSQNKWESFCNELIRKKIKRYLNDESVSPEEIFGRYHLNEIIKEELGIRGATLEGAFKGSYENMLFKKLAEKDDSFRKYLRGRGIDPKEPIAKNQIENKSIFLKHKVKVLYRYIYKDRTRKAPPINYGIPYIYDICDGNPRSIIGLVDEMFLNTNLDKNNNKQINYSKQTDIIIEASHKYFNLIKNHPDSTLIIRNRPFNLATDLIGKIGNYIYERLVKEDFNKSVPTTFIIDPEIDNKILTLLEHALHLGAIVYLDPLESLSRNGLISKRFRISYLLTPLFRIPNRVDGQINLKTILLDDERDNGQGNIFYKSVE